MNRKAWCWLLLAVVPASISTQVRQYRLVPDATFDASSLELTWPPSVRVDGQMQVYVADRGSNTMQRLSPDGRQAEIVLRDGAGPGEVRGIAGMGWKGDSLWLYDNRLTRFTFLDPDGKLVRTALYNDLCTTTLPWALLADGACLESIQTRHPYAKANDPRPPVPVIVTWGGKRAADTIGMVDFTASSMQFDRKDGGVHMAQPFHDVLLHVPLVGGRGILEVQGSIAKSNQPDSVRFRLWQPVSGWSAWRSLAYLPKPLSRATIDSTLEVIDRRIPPAGRWVTLDSLKRKANRPAFFPPIGAIISTSDETFWLRVEDRTTVPGKARWVVLNRTLDQTMVVDAPAELRINDVRGLYCWGTLLDEEDVPTIVRYKLVPQ